MSIVTRPCPSCRRTLVGRIRTDGTGRLVEEWPPCICESGAAPVQLQTDELTYEERAAAARQTGICMDCDAPVEGRAGWALRCAEHKRRARRESWVAASRTKGRLAARRRYDRRRRKSKEFRDRRNARRRELHAERMANDSAYAAEYRRRRQRETSITAPGYEKRMDYFRRTNADPARAESKRQQARRRYYELHPDRPRPVCATCGTPVDWQPGHGRPPKYHPTEVCHPRYKYDVARRAA